LDRVTAYEAAGCWFDSSQAHILVHSVSTKKMLKVQQYYMQEALKEAQRAFQEEEVPVGAVIVHQGKIIARGHNQIERLKDPTAHAEIIAITSAANYLGAKWLNEASLYVTIEPCSMCAGALVLARIKNLYFGASDPKTGACGSIIDIVNHKKLNHRIKVTRGILQEECGSILKDFFSRKRAAKSKNGYPREKAV
jgi:tRNA(adenine34) deaminase